MKHFQTHLLLAASLFAAGSALAQTTPSPNPKESSGVQHLTTKSGPIVARWRLKKIDGVVNLIVNPDGTYLFSGDVKEKKPDHDFNIAFALKSSLGGVIVFQHSGNMSNGLQWSKQGKSALLKDDYQTFAKAAWGGEWRISLNAAGEAKRYEAREKRKERLRKEEEEASKRHEEKVAAEKKAEREKIEQEQIAEAQAAAQREQSGGGSSIGSEISGIASTVGSVVSTISSVGQAIAGLF
ncbi:MAG TPA: hypothetical protein VKU00_03595 [Chthonomonadaceae bacterium]|nr:hypothetical protein [Chthonomonadaceae bacterium]